MVVIVEAEESGQITVVCADASFYVTHEAAIVLTLQLHVHHVVLLLHVVAYELALLRALVEDLQFLHGVVGQIVEHHLVLSLEEVFAVQREVVHLLAVDVDVAVVLQLCTWHLADKTVEHRAFWQVEGRSIINQRVAAIGKLHFGARDDDTVHTYLFIYIIVAALLLLHQQSG